MEAIITVLLFLLGILLIVKGGDIFVDSASWIAEISGIPKFIIGATIVSLATTLPELLVSVIATAQGKNDMAVGNAIGSNLFNLLGVLSASAAISPITHISAAFTVDCIWMIALTLLIWLLMRTDYLLTRIEGAVLLAVYVVYILSAAW